MGRERIRILDGGMGTTLESSGHSVSSDLWGSELLHTHPEVIQGIHRGYVEAGADLVESCTYQLTPSNLSSYLASTTCNTSEECDRQSKELLRTSVNLVSSSLDSTNASQGVVFSCGPYGSTLKPGAEYSGIYPPPFGPNSTIPGEKVKVNYFPLTEEGRALEEEAINHLTQFHLDRLLSLIPSGDGQEVWRKIEWIGFETIPLLYEIKAIRRCMAELNRILREKYEIDQQKAGEEGEDRWYIKKFWISSPFPDARHPQLSSNNQPITVESLLQTLLDPEEGAIPHGVGINCTNPSYLPALTDQFTQAIKPKIRKMDSPPRFVLYPDGGQVYDVNTRTWSNPPDGPANAVDWAKGVLTVVKELEEDRDDEGRYTWDGVIVGGCCKTSFGEIRALKRGLDGLYV
ncbi:hypothetical protein I302_100211 [Kwoniella bestiolae CBS 10118]|uniref:Hcy-binding domain-containing protein n=1 Tax=Kwoniella bestiolae CBS 10118 TaxID=1296100 RepID=A0A1B9G4I8_9TREE|nr:hypothetical protein I302_03584 [Kwoniella bestiolae CBS 10118]OCF25908.1 hypothetical protein I302_03584 [Kwoniella bestiolae CBS 10118]